jgi:hypothetical protein
MPIFGITASSNKTIKLTDFYQIATTTLGSAQSTITFSSIPQDYTHLQIRGIARDNTVGTSFDDIKIQFNSDTASNYSRHYLNGDGANAASGATTSTTYIGGFLVKGANTASVFAVNVIDILDYTDTNKYTTVKNMAGADRNGAGEVFLFSGNWRNTAAITTITLSPLSGSFAQYTSFALYGIKG